MSHALALSEVEARLKARGKNSIQLVCSGCGATADAACSCGVPYMPAGEKAKVAISNTPHKSDRAIAEDIGVGKDTVRRARKATGASAPVREGKDGKKRKQPKPKTSAENAEAWIAAEGTPGLVKRALKLTAIMNEAERAEFLIGFNRQHPAQTT